MLVEKVLDFLIFYFETVYQDANTFFSHRHPAVWKNYVLPASWDYLEFIPSYCDSFERSLSAFKIMHNPHDPRLCW